MRPFKFYTYCVIAGIMLTLWSNVALAQDGEVTYKYLLNSLFGIVLVLIGAYVKGFKDSSNERVDRLEHRLKNNETALANAVHEIHEVENQVAREYHTKADLREIIRTELEPLKVQIHSIQNMRNQQ